MKKNYVGGFMLPEFKTYYKVRKKQVWYWHKNSIKMSGTDPEIDLNIHGQFIFDRSVKLI